jgi:hypothetical protein
MTPWCVAGTKTASSPPRFPTVPPPLPLPSLGCCRRADPGPPSVSLATVALEVTASEDDGTPAAAVSWTGFGVGFPAAGVVVPAGAVSFALSVRRLTAVVPDAATGPELAAASVALATQDLAGDADGDASCEWVAGAPGRGCAMGVTVTGPEGDGPWLEVGDWAVACMTASLVHGDATGLPSAPVCSAPVQVASL